MYGLKNSFNKIYEEIQIPFKISEKDGTIIADFLKGKRSDIISIKIQNEELILETFESYKYCINLLKYCLDQELSNVVKSKEEIIKDLIKGKEFSDEILKEVIKYKPFKLIVIYQEENQEEVINSIKNKYIKEDSILVSQDKYLIIITKNNITYKQLENIHSLIEKNNVCYISYCKIDQYNELKEKFMTLKENIEICLKYELPSKVYKENSLILEKMIKSSDKNYIEKTYNKYNEIFSKLDKDLIKTIDIFFSEGLKVSESADKLYIHRNTLFYRIDKIKKLVNYDISNFNDAIEFKILFLLWKEIKFKDNSF